MEKVVLGRTGLEVSKLAFGGLFVQSNVIDEATKAVHRAIELGINYIDTAPAYGSSEEAMGKALAGVHLPVVDLHQTRRSAKTF